MRKEIINIFKICWELNNIINFLKLYFLDEKKSETTTNNSYRI